MEKLVKPEIAPKAHLRAARKPNLPATALMFCAGSLALCAAMFALLLLMDVYPLAIPHTINPLQLTGTVSADSPLLFILL